MNLSIFYRVSELTSTGCRDRSRKASVTDGQELHANHADFFPAAEVARHSVAPTDSMEEHQYFFIDIFHNLVESNLSKVSTDAKANPEFIKPERQEMYVLLQRQPHLCLWFGLPLCKVLVVHNAQRGAECAYLPPHGNVPGWRYSTSFMSSCVETIASSFVLMITFLPVLQACIQSDRWRNSSSLVALLLREASQFAGIGAPAITYCHCAFYDPL